MRLVFDLKKYRETLNKALYGQLGPFQAKQVNMLTGCKRTAIQQWLERGLLKPSVQMADGHGSRNLYSQADLYRMLLLKEMSELGIPLKYSMTVSNEMLNIAQETAINLAK